MSLVSQGGPAAPPQTLGVLSRRRDLQSRCSPNCSKEPTGIQERLGSDKLRSRPENSGQLLALGETSPLYEEGGSALWPHVKG